MNDNDYTIDYVITFGVLVFVRVLDFAVIPRIQSYHPPLSVLLYNLGKRDSQDSNIKCDSTSLPFDLCQVNGHQTEPNLWT